jgi:hypothetical protein
MTNADKFIEAIDKRISFWRNNPDDPHGIATAVLVALSEVRETVLEVCPPRCKALVKPTWWRPERVACSHRAVPGTTYCRKHQ